MASLTESVAAMEAELAQLRSENTELRRLFGAVESANQALLRERENVRSQMQLVVDELAQPPPDAPPPKPKKRRTSTDSAGAGGAAPADGSAPSPSATPATKGGTDAPAAPPQSAVTQTPATTEVPPSEETGAAAGDPRVPAAVPTPEARWACSANSVFHLHPVVHPSTATQQAPLSRAALCGRIVAIYSLTESSTPPETETCTACLALPHPAAASLRTWFATDPSRQPERKLHAVPAPAKARGART